MIQYKNNEMKNCWTEGFEVTPLSGMSIEVGEGRFYEVFKDIGERPVYINGEYKGKEPYIENRTKGSFYPAFDLELVPDDEFEVHYHVYLVDQPSFSGELVHIARIEFDIENLPKYEGQDSFCHLMLYIKLPPNCKTLDEAFIEIQNIKQVGEF
jgi:hypothetical protein